MNYVPPLFHPPYPQINRFTVHLHHTPSYHIVHYMTIVIVRSSDRPVKLHHGGWPFRGACYSANYARPPFTLNLPGRFPVCSHDVPHLRHTLYYGAVTGGERIAILLADTNGQHDLLLSHSLVVIHVNRSLGKALFFVISQD